MRVLPDATLEDARGSDVRVVHGGRCERGARSRIPPTVSWFDRDGVKASWIKSVLHGASFSTVVEGSPADGRVTTHNNSSKR